MAYIGNSPGVASQRVVTTFTATAGQTTFTPSSGYTLGYCDVFFNGVKLVNGDDYTASNGTSVVLASAAAAGDSVEIVAHFPRGLSDGYLKSEADALLAQKLGLAGGTVTGQVTVQRNSTISTNDFYASSPTLRLRASGANTIAGLYFDSEGPTGGGRAAGAVYVEPVPQDSWRGNLVHVYTADGSIGSYSIRQFHPANAATYERFKIDSGGRVTMPYQPAFHVIRNTSGSDTTNSSPLIYGQVIENNGNCYNASTGRFTAQVAGRYFFSAGAHQNAGNGYITTRLVVAGVQIANAWNNNDNIANSSSTQFISGIKYMNVGDTAEVTFDTTKSSNYMAETYWYFNGYLIG